ncbi:hypothetical protein ACF0H5_015848 [Mactra antiquata]
MDNRKRSHSLDINMLHDGKLSKTPLIQVTQVIHPDDTDDDHVLSPRHLSRGGIPTIGIDNLSFVPEEDDIANDSDDSCYKRELDDVHTPLPKTPFGFTSRRESNSSTLSIDTENVVSAVRKGSSLLERRRHSAGQTLADKSSLAVPSMKLRNQEVPFEEPSMIWFTQMKAFWRSNATKRQYQSVTVITSSCVSEDDDSDDVIDNGIPLRDLDVDVKRPLLARRLVSTSPDRLHEIQVAEVRKPEVPFVGPPMIWFTQMKAFWHSNASKRQYQSVTVITSSCVSDDDDSGDVIDNGIPLRDLDGDVKRPLLTSRLVRNQEVPFEGPPMIWFSQMKAFWRSSSTKRQYQSVTVITSSCVSDSDDSDDVIDNGIPLRALDGDVKRPLLTKRLELIQLDKGYKCSL